MVQRVSLLEGAIDYAGLFAPAALPLTEAMASYGRYRGGEDSWALGRFVLPANLLAVFQEHASSDTPTDVPPWELSVTLSPNHVVGLGQLRTFQETVSPQVAVVCAVEGKVTSPAAVQELVRTSASGIDLFLEIDLGPDTETLVKEVAQAGGLVKFRTGGVTTSAIPQADVFLRGLEAVVGAGVSFKCTAGLHHPVRGTYPLTYDAGSAVAMMYGYLNVFFAVGFIMAGWRSERVKAVLLETAAEAFQLSEDHVAWRGEVLPDAAIARLRRTGLRSFGSCSFREPLDELVLLAVP